MAEIKSKIIFRSDFTSTSPISHAPHPTLSIWRTRAADDHYQYLLAGMERCQKKREKNGRREKDLEEESDNSDREIDIEEK